MILQAVQQARTVVDTVYDTVRVRVVDSIHVRILDTLGVVLPSSPESDPLAQLFAPIATLLIGAASAYAAWEAAGAASVAAHASTEQVAAARGQLDAAEHQRGLADESLALQRRIQDESREATKERRKQKAVALKTRSKRIRRSIEALDPGRPLHGQLIQFSILSVDDVDRLECLAEELSAEAAELAGTAALSLRVIEGMVQTARGTTAVVGWIPSGSEVKNYKAAIESSTRLLTRLERECDRVLAL